MAQIARVFTLSHLAQGINLGDALHKGGLSKIFKYLNGLSIWRTPALQRFHTSRRDGPGPGPRRLLAHSAEDRRRARSSAASLGAVLPAAARRPQTRARRYARDARGDA